MNELSSTPASASSPADSSSLRRELEQVRAELKEIQRKSERDVKALNQEVSPNFPFNLLQSNRSPTLRTIQVSELEALVESKIYREDELETELEHFKSLLAKHSIPGTGTSTSTLTGSHSKKSSRTTDDEDGEGSCEMCGESGHDLDSCPECEFFSSDCCAARTDDRKVTTVLGSASPNKRRSPVSPTRSDSSTNLHHSRTTSTLLIQANGKDGGAEAQEWCDDCEGKSLAIDLSDSFADSIEWKPLEFGHSLENCPLAAEIF